MTAVLKGVKVVELGTMITAPLAGMMLADLGAEVSRSSTRRAAIRSAASAAASTVRTSSPTIAASAASDLPEYFPGETVTLTGSGWTPGETVTIVLHRQPLRAARHRADVGGRRERNDHEHVVYAPHPTTSA